MLRATLFSSAVLLSSTLTSASPSLFPRSCTPNLQGQSQTIYGRPPITDVGIYEWIPDSISPGAHITMHQHNVNDAYAQGEFLVEPTTHSNESYRFRLAADTSRRLALTAGSGGALAFDIARETFDPAQEFTINCDTCPLSDGDGQAKSCIIGHPVSGKCVTGSGDGVTLQLAGCDVAGKYWLWKGF